MIEHFFNDKNEMFNELAELIANDLTRIESVEGRASIAVSGGTTPIPLFEQLSTMSLNWNNVMVTLTDERWVGTDNPESNERMVKAHLLNHKASVATFVPLKTDDTNPESGVQTLEKILKQKIPTLDIVVLGMGNDGHFASLFPLTPQLGEGLSLNNKARSIAVTSPLTTAERISLTLSMLLTASKIYLLITGDDKLKVLKEASRQARDGDGDGDGDWTLPVTAVLHQNKVPVHVFWSANREA